MTDEKSDDRLARAVSWTLFSGLTVSVVLIVLGWFFILRAGGSSKEHADGLRVILSRAVQGDGTAILGLGLVVLMFTPVARVLILAAGWAKSRDWTFSLIAFVVLALLGLSIYLGTG